MLGKRSWFDDYDRSEATMTMSSSTPAHNVSNLAYLAEVKEIDSIHLTIADGYRASITHKGKILIIIRDRSTKFQDVYYIPALQLNVLSCTHLHLQTISKTIVKGQCSFHYRRENIYLGSVLLDGKVQLYLVPINAPKLSRSK